MARQRRAVTRPQKTVQKFDTKWPLNDKRRLLAGLRRFESGNVRAIRRNYLPHRSDKEIAWFTNRMRVKGGLLRDDMNIGATRLKANVECWLRLIEDLTLHCKDYSFNLFEVMKKMADSESHDPTSTRYNPDWSQVYRYLVASLSGLELPPVGQVEATIILTLMEKLMVHLKTLDVSTQRWLARRKFEMVAVRSGATEEALSEARRALETDIVATEMQNAVLNGSTASGTVPGVTPVRYPSYIAGTSTSIIITNPRSQSDSKLYVPSTNGQGASPVVMPTVTKGSNELPIGQPVVMATVTGASDQLSGGQPISMETINKGQESAKQPVAMTTNESVAVSTVTSAIESTSQDTMATVTKESSAGVTKVTDSGTTENGSNSKNVSTPSGGTGIWSRGSGGGTVPTSSGGTDLPQAEPQLLSGAGKGHFGSRKRGRGLDRCESSVRLISAEQQKPNYGLNPLCVPIRYINPKARIKVESVTSPGFSDPQRLRGLLREVKQAAKQAAGK